LITTIGFNFIYTFNFVRWLVTYVGTGYDIRDIFIFTKNKGPLTIAMQGGMNLKYCDSCKKSENDCQCFAFCITFILFSALKIVDFFSYTNSSLIMFYIMGRSAKVFDLFGVDIPQDPKIKTILRKMSFTVLWIYPKLWLVFIQYLKMVKLNLLYLNLQLLLALTILRIGISILFSVWSFIMLYFVYIKLAVRDSQLKLLG
jgi:hypothetical protein